MTRPGPRLESPPIVLRSCTVRLELGHSNFELIAGLDVGRFAKKPFDGADHVAGERVRGWLESLGGQVKSGQLWTGQNRPTAGTQDQFASTPRRLRPATSDAFASFAART